VNKITGPYSAEIRGKSTGLAGCSDSHKCPVSEYCLRADSALMLREPFYSEPCPFFIDRENTVL